MIRVRRLGNKSLDMKATVRRPLPKSPQVNAKEFDLLRPSSLLPLILHVFACCASMFIGHQLVKEVGFVLKRSNASLKLDPPFEQGSSSALIEPDHPLNIGSQLLYRGYLFSQEMKNKVQRHNRISGVKTNSTRVGRHGILIRDYPHPDPLKIVLASELIDLLQEEQFRRFSPNTFRPLIVITPTYSRTFQKVHMIHLVNSLRQARSPLVWIVVEANKKTNDTKQILVESGLDFVHLDSKVRLSDGWHERELAEVRLREVGLRYVQSMKLDGLVMFADDTAVFSRSFFEEAQKVEWIGAMSVGINIHETFSQTQDKGKAAWTMNSGKRRKILQDERVRLPVQGPVCDENKTLIGWHTYPHYPQDFMEGLPEYAKESQTRSPMVWLGFVLNSRLIWGRSDAEFVEDSVAVPKWIKPFSQWIGDEDVGGSSVTAKSSNRLDLLKRVVLDESKIEPLGKCGTVVMAWWLKADARSDSKYPLGWLIPNLELVVPSKSTPWEAKAVGDNSTALAGAVKKHSKHTGGKKTDGGTKKNKKGKKTNDEKVSKAREDLDSLEHFTENESNAREEQQ